MTREKPLPGPGRITAERGKFVMDMSAMMSGMGLISILVILLLGLIGAALIKYLFFG